MIQLKRFVLLCAVLMPLLAWGQNISVSSAVGQNIATFVNNQLIGDGVYVWNVKFQNTTGNIGSGYPQIGTFLSNGFPYLQMDTGVVMTTGNISVAPGPNNSSGLSTPVSSPYSDATMVPYASPNSVNGCSTLDFDFVSISPFITLNYCFGSEEYQEYVWSTFNDLFAFLVTGPNPVTGQSETKNIAIIPHTVSSSNPNGIVVAINSVNGGTNGSTTTPPTSNCVNCYNTFTEFYVNNTYSTGVEYDGFTQKLSANATLLPCEQYHMHITICNVGDNSFDSGVFLEKKSFNSPSAEVNLSHRYADTIERSAYTVLPLSLAGSNYNYGNVTVSFGGDAVVGEDYTVVTDSGDFLDETHHSFNVSTNQHSLTFHGTPTADLSEPKLIELYLATSLCQQYLDLKTFDTIRYILREDDVVRLKHDTIVAYDTCKQVGVELAVGTHPPYSFRWRPETDIDFPNQQYSTASITESRTYNVKVVDAQGHTDSTDIFVQVLPRTHQGVEQQPEIDFSIYPNPTDGEMNIEADGITFVEVFNAAGVCVFSRRCNSDCRTLNISPLPAGLYFVRITTHRGIITEKVVVR